MYLKIYPTSLILQHLHETQMYLSLRHTQTTTACIANTQAPSHPTPLMNKPASAIFATPRTFSEVKHVPKNLVGGPVSHHPSVASPPPTFHPSKMPRYFDLSNGITTARNSSRSPSSIASWTTSYLPMTSKKKTSSVFLQHERSHG